MNGLLKTIILVVAGIFLISSEPINNHNNTVQSKNNNEMSSNNTLNEQVNNDTENKYQSLSNENAMEICNQTFQTPKGIRI